MKVPLRCIKPETIPDPYVIGVSMAGLGTDSTRVFRMPIDDATAPDLMKSTKIVNPVISIIKGPKRAIPSRSSLLRPRSGAIPPTPSS